MTFDGDDYVEERDYKRLKTQLEVITEYMEDAGFKTLDEIARDTGYRSASISAQLRNLRKEKFGSRNVSRKHIGNGLYSYKLEATNEA